MKRIKDNLQLTLLFISTLSIIGAIFSIILDSESFYEKNEIFLCFAAIIVSVLFAFYFLLIIRRINPRQYIYISYTEQDKETAHLISQILNDHFMKLSKYRFEIRTVDTIPFGDDMYSASQKYLKESDIIIVIVSEAYLNSDWCRMEFRSIANSNKRIIPIVMNSYDYLSRLPVDMSNVKALLLHDCTSGQDFEKDFESQLLRLAKDLVRQRND